MTVAELEAAGLPIYRGPVVAVGRRYRVDAPGMDSPAFGTAVTSDAPGGRLTLTLDGTGQQAAIPVAWCTIVG